MERLVEIRPGHGDEVFDASRYWAPDVMHDAENSVAILNRLRDHAHGKEVINLIHSDALLHELVVNTEETLNAALDFGGDPGFLQLIAQNLHNAGQKLLPLLPARFHEFANV